MKRLIIEGDIKRHGPTATGGDRWVVESDQGVLELWVRDATPGVTITVEDIPDPLPTEPGATFIGYATKVRNLMEPIRWLVVEDVDAEGTPDPSRITYVSQRYQEWSPGEAERYGLVRLPDPEVTQ